jgi:hypothetical protein
MKTSNIILCILLFSARSFAQGMHWEHATDWTVYNVQNKNIWALPIDSLELFNHKELNSDSMQIFLAKTTAISPKSPVWMGAYVTTCILDHKKRKIEISTYGGFFYDDSAKQYYQLPLNVQKDWLNYLANFDGIQSAN